MKYELSDIHPEAIVAPSAQIWDLVQIRQLATVGENTIVGRGVYIGVGVNVGANCKIQNYALLYEPAKVSEGVFIGPGVIFTNDKYPRAVTPELKLLRPEDWTPVGVQVGEGASIGARSVCIAPVFIGRWAMIAAGSVVTKNVPDFALVMGTPARRIGWVGKFGQKLVQDKYDESIFLCPATKSKFQQKNQNTLVELSPENI